MQWNCFSFLCPTFGNWVGVDVRELAAHESPTACFTPNKRARNLSMTGDLLFLQVRIRRERGDIAKSALTLEESLACSFW